jgi:L-amino acid N-acyltransferase YncA
LGYSLTTFRKEDEKALYQIFQKAAGSENEFHFECNSLEEFHRDFLNPHWHLFVLRSSKNQVVGGFYIRPNLTGRASHIANAGYMIAHTHRGKGFGALLVKASLRIAKELGFQAMQFNMVLNQNRAAIKLYQKLGFHLIGTIPQAVRNPDGSYQDGQIMFRKLEDKNV